MSEESIELAPIGWVESSLDDPVTAPKQGDEGAPDAWLVIDADLLEGLDGIQAGDPLLVLTWLDRARRDVLAVHPRSDASRPVQGVFGTRSPDRPNPIGLHRVKVAEIDRNRLRVRQLEALDGTPILDRNRLRVRQLEALDGTPILDLKPVLSAGIGER